MLKGVDLVTSNVPGAPIPVFIAGGQIEALFAFGPMTGAAANITLLSYLDDLHIGINLDPAAVTDPSASSSATGRAGTRSWPSAAPPSQPRPRSAADAGAGRVRPTLRAMHVPDHRRRGGRGRGPGGRGRRHQPWPGPGGEVVLVDKATFPRDKICGDGLTTGALRVLEDLGVEPARGGVVDGGRRHRTSASPSAPTGPSPSPTGRALRRGGPRGSTSTPRSSTGPGRPGPTVARGPRGHGAADRAGDRVRARPLDGGDAVRGPLRDRRRRHVVAGAQARSGTAVPGYLGECARLPPVLPRASAPARPRPVGVVRARPAARLRLVVPAARRRRQRRASASTGAAKVAVQDMERAVADAAGPARTSRAVLGPDAEPEGRHRAWPIPARVDDMPLTAAAGCCSSATPRRPPTRSPARASARRCCPAGWPPGRSSPAASTPRPRPAAATSATCAARCVADHRMSVAHDPGARRPRVRPGRPVGSPAATDWARRNFARWMFEDEPRAIVATPRRWHRDILGRPGAYLESR